MVPESAPARTAPSPVPTSHKAAGMAPVTVTSSVCLFHTEALPVARDPVEGRVCSVRGPELRPPSRTHGHGHTVSHLGSA